MGRRAVAYLPAHRSPRALGSARAFLQQTTPSSTLVVVHTDAPATVELRDTRDAVLARSEKARQHHLRLSGLPPASSITYQLVVDGARVGAPATFRTPAVPGTEEARRVTLGVIGDMGSGGANERANVQQLEGGAAGGAEARWGPALQLPRRVAGCGAAHGRLLL